MIRCGFMVVMMVGLMACPEQSPEPTADVTTDTVTSPDTTRAGDSGVTDPTDVVVAATPDEIKRAILGHVADDVVIATLTDFAEKVGVLVEATEAYATGQTPETLEAAQEAWRQAMMVWQQAEVMQVGPAGIMGEVPGGEDLRDEIYSWAITNPCRVDQETLEDAHKDPNVLAAESVNTRGLDAIEYLLFHPADENACKINSGINKNGTWKDMAAEIPGRQARYAASAAILVQKSATKLLDKWKSSFGDTLKTAGEGSKLFSTLQEGLNAVSDAMFYVDTFTKDMKLAEPTGISGCDSDVCVNALESRWAHFSKESVLYNLKGTARLFYGSEDKSQALGFDDLLIAVGAGDLATDMGTALDEAIQAIEAFEGTWADALESDPSQVQAIFDKVKAFTDLLKTQFMSVLDLEVPSRAASDND